MPSLLLVEDDRQLATLLLRVLGDEGYDVTHALDGHTGLHLGLTRAFDVLLVDRGLPAVEGLDLIGRLRRRGLTAPVLVLSARGSTQDRVEGLDAGAEDYLAKPFEVSELLARLRALLRRHRETAPVLQLGTATLALEERVVRLDDGSEVELSERESDLLALLATHPRQVFTRQDLMSRVFGEAESETVVDTYVHYCRKKLGKGVVRTVRGVGFRMGVL